jgi:16S rRNA (cytosine967-C5)-methyltransferase
VRLSFPEDLYREVVKAHGPSVAEEVCRAQNERAMLTVRANTVKTTREELIHTFKKNGWKVQPTQFAPNGIKFLARPQGNLFMMQEHKEGHFEVQDEASQLLAMRVDARPG